jgi:hypothetical protein
MKKYFALVLLLSACMTSKPSVASKMAEMDLGMSKKQVIGLLGRPSKAATTPGLEGPDAEVFSYDDDGEVIYVVFKEAKVWKYGPETVLVKYFGDAFGIIKKAIDK